MQANFEGEIKHVLDEARSQSFHAPLQFDPTHNEIVLIGTDVDKIERKSQLGSREQCSEAKRPGKTPIPWAMRAKVRSCVPFLDERAAQKAASSKPMHINKNRPLAKSPSKNITNNPNLNPHEEDKRGVVKPNLSKSSTKKAQLMKVSTTPELPVVTDSIKKTRYSREGVRKPLSVTPMVIEVTGVETHGDDIHLDRTFGDQSEGSIWGIRRRNISIPCPTQDDEEKCQGKAMNVVKEDDHKKKGTREEIRAKTPMCEVNVKGKKQVLSISHTQDEEKNRKQSIQVSRCLNPSESSNSITPLHIHSITKDSVSGASTQMEMD